MLDAHIVTLQSHGSLIKELIDATLVRLLTICKETGKELETGNLIEWLVACYPLIGNHRRIVYMLQQVEGKHLSHLLALYLFHPDIRDLGKHPVGRHDERSQNLALPDIFLPELDG